MDDQRRPARQHRRHLYRQLLLPWPGGEQYYDPYWALLAEATANQGYLSPLNDGWSNFSPDFGLDQGASITWELGIATTS